MRGLAVLLIAAGLVGCDVLGPGERLEPGLLGSGSSPFAVSLPDTVDAGVDVDVEIPVFGSGSCTRVARVDVVPAASGALVRPWVATEIGNCTADLREFTATGSLVLEERGRAEIRVQGRYLTVRAGRSTTRDTTVVFETWVK